MEAGNPQSFRLSSTIRNYTGHKCINEYIYKVKYVQMEGQFIGYSIYQVFLDDHGEDCSTRYVLFQKSDQVKTLRILVLW